MSAEVKVIAITGATGFIGRHLVSRLLTEPVRIRALTRQPIEESSDVDWIRGDISDRVAVSGFVRGAGTVVNLAFSGVTPAATSAESARDLVRSCVDGGASHLIHCSSVSVYGATRGEVLDESSPCRPKSSYERVKRAIEEGIFASVADHPRLRLTNFRPAAVFGSGGLNLVSLLRGVTPRRTAGAFAKSVLFGARSMNLVPVSTVVNALVSAAIDPESLPAGTLIISHDDDPLNNFRDVERLVMNAAGIRSRLRYPSVPPSVLELLLRALGRAHGQPFRRYISRYPEWASSIRSETLEQAIARWVAEETSA